MPIPRISNRTIKTRIFHFLRQYVLILESKDMSVSIQLSKAESRSLNRHKGEVETSDGNWQGALMGASSARLASWMLYSVLCKRSSKNLSDCFESVLSILIRGRLEKKKSNKKGNFFSKSNINSKGVLFQDSLLH